MADKSWKRFERECAKDIGTQRIPVTGIDRDGADFQHGMFAYQAKHRRMIPAWLFDWLKGICGVAKRTDQIGVLILNRPGKDRKDALVIVRWEDWCDLHGTPTDERAA